MAGRKGAPRVLQLFYGAQKAHWKQICKNKVQLSEKAPTVLCGVSEMLWKKHFENKQFQEAFFPIGSKSEGDMIVL